MAAREAAVFVRRRRRVHGRCDRTCDAVLKGKRSAGPVLEQLLAFSRNVACFRRRQRGLFGARWGKIRGSRFPLRGWGWGLGASCSLRIPKASAERQPAPSPQPQLRKKKRPGERCGGRTARQTLGALSGAFEVPSHKSEVASRSQVSRKSVARRSQVSRTSVARRRILRAASHVSLACDCGLATDLRLQSCD